MFRLYIWHCLFCQKANLFTLFTMFTLLFDFVWFGLVSTARQHACSFVWDHFSSFVIYRIYGYLLQQQTSISISELTDLLVCIVYVCACNVHVDWLRFSVSRTINSKWKGEKKNDSESEREKQRNEVRMKGIENEKEMYATHRTSFCSIAGSNTLFASHLFLFYFFLHLILAYSICEFLCCGSVYAVSLTFQFHEM